jgi:serine/threonine protein kinase
LPVDRAIRITVALAGALDYTHRNGVIHHDLKLRTSSCRPVSR